MSVQAEHGERLAKLESASDHLATSCRHTKDCKLAPIKWLIGAGIGIATIASAIASIIVSMAIS